MFLQTSFISRRAFALGTAGWLGYAAPACALPVQRSGALLFDIWRKQRRIGTHELHFSVSNGTLSVDIAVRVNMSFEPITIFHYRLDGIEKWRDRQVFHVATTTNNDGEADDMRADRHPQGLIVQGSKVQTYVAPANALPATHWNQVELNGPWINLQNGRLLHPSVMRLGADKVRVANGDILPARHYRVSGDFALQLWYGYHRQWLSLAFTGKDGSNITYLRRDG